jgi:hypothetical protein
LIVCGLEEYAETRREQVNFGAHSVVAAVLLSPYLETGHCVIHEFQTDKNVI